MQTPGGDTIGDDTRPMLNVAGNAGTDLLGIPQGPGITFTGKAGRENWFHFAIPTPTFFWRSDADRGNAKVIRVLVNGLFLERSSRLIGVDLWDGENPLAQDFGVLDFPGRFRVNLECRGGPREVHFGLGISVHISFGNANSTFAFHGAGADFEVRD